MTHKQTKALKYQAYKHDIGSISYENDRKGRPHYRNLGTGRFVSRLEAEKRA